LPCMVSLLFSDLHENPGTPVDSVRIKHEDALRWLMENNPHTLRRILQQKRKKRARDKILRDPNTSKAAMHFRKQGAFLGYTYRRAGLPKNGDELSLFSRGSVLPGSGFGWSLPVAG
jgi:hypothetical protein